MSTFRIIKVPCKHCGVMVEVLEDHAHIGAICSECIDLEDSYYQIRIRNQRLLTRWLEICPPMYQDSILESLPFPRLSMRVIDWQPAKICSGLNLWGFPRTGKTRTMFLVLKRRYYQGYSVKAFGPSEFAQECEMRDFKTAGWIRRLAKYDVLAFDDVDKCRMSRTQEEKFFALLDTRIREFKPIIFTGNSTAPEFSALFRNGAAIVARIREHFLSVHFPQKEKVKAHETH